MMVVFWWMYIKLVVRILWVVFTFIVLDMMEGAWFYVGDLIDGSWVHGNIVNLYDVNGKSNVSSKLESDNLGPCYSTYYSASDHTPSSIEAFQGFYYLLFSLI